MARTARKAPATSDELEARRARMMRAQAEENLPEFDQRKAADPKIAKWIADQEGRIAAAVRDADEGVFEDVMGTWLKACHRVNELIAEDYRQANPDATTWDLRYFKWMKVAYIRFGCELGEFCLVPRRGRRPPTQHWYTADEMIGMVNNPAIGAAIKLAGRLPIRPESLPPPAAGEKHLNVDLTGPEPKMFYTMGGTHGGAGFRRQSDQDDS